MKSTNTIKLISKGMPAIPNSSLLSNVIGQKGATKKLKFFVESHSKDTPFPTVLLTGSHGLGKSYLAKMIAGALGRKFVEVNCSDLKSVSDLMEGVLLKMVMGNVPTTILFDEAHALSFDVRTLLLSLLNPNSQDCNHVAYKESIIEYDMRLINVVFATTDSYKIPKPLRNRCEESYLSHYSNEDLFLIMKMYCPDVDFLCDKEDLAYACRGRARDTFMLAGHVERLCHMEKTITLTHTRWEKLKDVFGIFPLGLNAQEIELLNIIKDTGTISCRNIAIKMGIEEENVHSEIEIRPKELGLMDNGSRGRFLTDEGAKYISDLS